MGGIITVDELLTHIGITGDDVARVDYPVLTTVIASAEQTVAMETGRTFVADPAFVAGADTDPPVTKTFRVRRRNQTVVRIPDLRSATSVVLDGNTLTEGIGFDFNTSINGEPYTHISLYFTQANLLTWGASLSASSILSVTGRWGFVPVPDDVHEITLQIAARKWYKRDAQFADQLEISNTQGGSTRDYRAGLTTEQAQTLNRYRLPSVAVV